MDLIGEPIEDVERGEDLVGEPMEELERWYDLVGDFLSRRLNVINEHTGWNWYFFIKD